MIQVYSDLITVYCDHCASTIKLYSSGLTEPLDDAIRGAGWRVDRGAGEIPNVGAWFSTEHTCRACIRKAQGKGRRD